MKCLHQVQYLMASGADAVSSEMPLSPPGLLSVCHAAEADL